MYNDYVSDDFYHAQFTPSDVEILNNPDEVLPDNNYIEKSNNSIFSGLFNNTTMPDISSETLILFAIIFFAIYDDFDTDLLIILGILFLIGI